MSDTLRVECKTIQGCSFPACDCAIVEERRRSSFDTVTVNAELFDNLVDENRRLRLAVATLLDEVYETL